VDELARNLGLSPMCIRQHLALLERDGLVSPREVRRRTGRPHYFYTLTERADDLFPKSYDRLATLIIEEIKASEGPERLLALMNRLGDRIGEEYAPSLADKPIEDKMAAVVNILGDGSPLGAWHKNADGYVLHEYDCPFHRVSTKHPEVCQLHARVLVRILGAEVTREESMACGDVRCTYRVKPASN
jgi:predicted ArsR family transcriptional regulator